MARHLAVDKTQGISHLHDSGMSNRQIAKALGINRKSVDKHVAEVIAKRANDSKAPTAQAPTGSDDSKRATSDKAPTGALDALPCTDSSAVLAPKRESSSDSSRSECASFREAEVLYSTIGVPY